MDNFSFLQIQFLVFVAIAFFLLIQMLAIKKGVFVKVEYTRGQRFFWAVFISFIFAANSLIFSNIYFLFLAIVGGLYLYYFKQYYALKRNKH